MRRKTHRDWYVVRHYSWRQYYVHVRASGSAGPALAGLIASWAYLAQTFKLG